MDTQDYEMFASNLENLTEVLEDILKQFERLNNILENRK